MCGAESVDAYQRLLDPGHGEQAGALRERLDALFRHKGEIERVLDALEREPGWKPQEIEGWSAAVAHGVALGRVGSPLRVVATRDGADVAWIRVQIATGRIAPAPLDLRRPVKELRQRIERLQRSLDEQVRLVEEGLAFSIPPVESFE